MIKDIGMNDHMHSMMMVKLVMKVNVEDARLKELRTWW